MTSPKIKHRAAILFLAGLIVYAGISTAMYNDGRDANSLQQMGLGVYCAEAPGDTTYGNDIVTIDISNAANGYIAANYFGTNDKIKITVAKEDSQNIYDVGHDKYGEYVILPLHAGDGDYIVSVWENMYDSTYMEVFRKEVNAVMEDEAQAFLYPSINVDFSENSLAVQEAEAIASTSGNDSEMAKAVYSYLSREIAYDYDLESYVLAGNAYKTDIDAVMEKRKGICIDYATVMAAMLRSHGVPTKVVVGSVKRGNDVLFPNHTWVSVCLRDEGAQRWIDVDPTHGATIGKQVGMKAPFVNYIADYYY